MNPECHCDGVYVHVLSQIRRRVLWSFTLSELRQIVNKGSVVPQDKDKLLQSNKKSSEHSSASEEVD